LAAQTCLKREIMQDKRCFNYYGGMCIMRNLDKLLQSSPEFKHNILRRVVQIIIAILLLSTLLFGAAGTFKWFYAWLYIGIYLLIPLIGIFLLPLDVIAERGSKKENVEPWDKMVTNFIIVSSLSIFLVAGLDFRWGWTPELSTIIHLLGMSFFLLGVAIEIWAMAVNHFFSTAVRIQFDRGHTVCSSGPYKFIRHPGYLGMILSYAFTPLYLGSLWAMIPAVMTSVLLVIRTYMEDQTLKQKLPGYKEYADHTRYRLIPWL